MTTKIAFSKMSLDHKIPPGDPIWPTFNASFENLDLETIEIANLIYTGHALTTWHKDHWRIGKNYQLGQHIGLDFDTEDERSTLPYLAADKFIQRYANIIYTTPSHTWEAPRSRILFLLDEPIHQPQNYTLAVSALLWLFGSADRQCKDPARFFYGSVSCDVELLDQTLPLGVVKSVIGQYQRTGAGEKRKHERNVTYATTVEQKKVASALKSIPAMDIEYEDWRNVLMGIHAEFGNGGLGLANSWAQGTPGEVERKWKSFNKSGNVTGAITIASVFALAIRYGWTGGI